MNAVLKQILHPSPYILWWLKICTLSYKTKLKVFIFFLLLSFQLFSGTPTIEKTKADLKKVNTLYANTFNYSLDMQYMVYDNYVNGNLIETKTGKYIKYNGSSYTKMLNIETIVNTKNTVVLNHEDNMLIITDSKKITLSPIQTNMDTILKMCSNIKFIDIGTTERRYTFVFNDNEDYSEYSKIEMYINLSNYSLKKLVLYYNQSLPLNRDDYSPKEKKPRLEIVYKTFKPIIDVNTSITELFNESNYLTLVGNNYKGTNQYSNYKVINQLSAYRFKKK